ncbi:MAG TPA: glycine--tRNA ligase subunit beta, partial [Thermoanaerobaculia bacterium]|nr:glycine--tRNA ligase subunit beta [Thermoanaerobaculia bacterium]
DTLVGLFGLGEVPSGSRDPFGLRRAAQGAVRIALERELPLDPESAVREAARLYGERLPRSADEILADFRPFWDDRVRHLLGLRGYAYDEIEAGIRSDRGAEGVQDLPDLAARVEALHRVRDEPAFLSVVLAAKRIANILRSAEGEEVPAAPDPALFEDEAEGELHRSAGELAADVEGAAERRDYEGALRRIADLAEVLETFFVQVLVMTEDRAVRGNRLALLRTTGDTLSRVARLTEMVVDREEHRKRGAEQ